MKYYKIVLLLIVTVAFFACKTADSSDTTTYQVTIDQNGGTGLTKTVYTVDSGSTLKESDLQGSSTLQYAVIASYLADDGNPFTLGQTQVQRDITIKIQWKNDSTIDCTTKTNDATKLFTFATAGDTFGIACSLKYGATIGEKDGNGYTALLRAIQNGDLGAIKYLIAIGSNVNVITTDRDTALMLAAANNHLDVVSYLVETVKVDARSTQHAVNRHNALTYAVDYGYFDIVKYLLDKAGANINDKDENGWTPLMYAVNGDSETIIGDRLKMVEYLASYPGVDLTAKDTTTGVSFSGMTALDIANSKATAIGGDNVYKQFAQALINAGAK